MKKLPFFILCLFINAAYANPESRCDAVPSPAVCKTRSNTSVFVDVFDWKAHEDGMAWAASQTTNMDVVSASPTTAEPNWRWQPGFRVGLGHQFNNAPDLSLTYTRYYTEATDSETFNSTTAIAFGLWDTNPSAGGSADWNLNYNTLDLAIKQPFFVGKRLTLIPSLSLYGASLSEKYIINNILPGTPPLSTNRIYNEQQLFSIGPKLGVNSIWNLTDSLSIFGEGSLALLWSSYDVTRVDTRTDGSGVTTNVDNLKNEFDTLLLVPTYSVGVQWDEFIHNDDYHLKFKLAWEQQIWLQYNRMFMLSVPNDNTLLFNNSNLSLYGVTLSAGVQF